VKRWRKALQWTAGLAVLAVLAWQIGSGDIWEHLRTLNPLDLALALGCAVVANGLSALRWRQIADDFGCAAPTSGFLVRYAQGVCLSTVLPGATLGGDAWRSAWLVGLGHSLTRASVTVLLDRVVGLWALAALALVGVWATQARLPEVLALAFSAIVGGPLVLLMLLGDRTPWVARLPRADAQLWWRAATWSFGVQALSNAALWFSCRAVGVDLTMSDLLVLAGGLFIAAALPLSVFGFGSREAAAAWLFPLFGVAADQGVAASIAFGLLGTLQGVLYLPLWWRRH